MYIAGESPIVVGYFLSMMDNTAVGRMKNVAPQQTTKKGMKSMSSQRSMDDNCIQQ